MNIPVVDRFDDILVTRPSKVGKRRSIASLIATRLAAGFKDFGVFTLLAWSISIPSDHPRVVSDIHYSLHLGPVPRAASSNSFGGESGIQSRPNSGPEPSYHWWGRADNERRYE